MRSREYQNVINPFSVLLFLLWKYTLVDTLIIVVYSFCYCVYINYTLAFHSWRLRLKFTLIFRKLRQLYIWEAKTANPSKLQSVTDVNGLKHNCWFLSSSRTSLFFCFLKIQVRLWLFCRKYNLRFLIHY